MSFSSMTLAMGARNGACRPAGPPALDRLPMYTPVPAKEIARIFARATTVGHIDYDRAQELVQRGEAVELYNLVEDPLEQHDLAAEDHKRTTVFSQHLGAWRKLIAATSLDPELRSGTLDEETVEQLKSLGYIQ